MCDVLYHVVFPGDDVYVPDVIQNPVAWHKYQQACALSRHVQLIQTFLNN
jgi:hypothetical protein